MVKVGVFRTLPHRSYSSPKNDGCYHIDFIALPTLLIDWTHLK